MEVVQMVLRRLMTEQRGEVLKAQLTEEKKHPVKTMIFTPYMTICLPSRNLIKYPP